MNERIKKLIVEAFESIDYPFKQEINMPDVLVEKFAELIVRECGYHADIFEAAGCPVDMDPTETKPSDYIKQHFGVEE